MKAIDRFLNNITMYRLTLYVLIILDVIALILSAFSELPFSPKDLIFSTTFLVCVSLISNEIFSRTFKASANVESVFITALILSLIISPSTNFNSLIFFGWAALLANASKYIFALKKKHVFNPAAFAVVATAIGMNQSASWWVGTTFMIPFVFIGGFLIMRKLQKEQLVLTFFVVSLVEIAVFTLIKGNPVFGTLETVLLRTPIIFFATVMLTEPLTTPPTKSLQILYGGIVGLLFPPQLHIGAFYLTPEMALIAGNIYSYLVSPKQKILLTLKEKNKVSSDIYDFVYTPDEQPSYEPGQYMEWTLPHEKPDSRGNRRYFTLASSPTEDNVRLGVKFYPGGSSYKNAMLNDTVGSQIVAGQLAGEFTLPKDKTKKLVMVAGGIGVTPYRSWIKYMLDKSEARPYVLLYSNKVADEIAYRDVFDRAWSELGVKTIYTLTDAEHIPSGWQGRVGRVDEKMITEEIPDYKERFFYLSGPHAMVTGFEETLSKMGVKRTQIKKDFFPGFA